MPWVIHKEKEQILGAFGVVGTGYGDPFILHEVEITVPTGERGVSEAQRDGVACPRDPAGLRCLSHIVPQLVREMEPALDWPVPSPHHLHRRQ